MVTLGCLHDLGHGTWQSHRKDPSMSMVRTSSGGAEQEWCAKGNHIPSGNIGVFQPLSASVYVNLPEGICCPQKIHPKSPCGFPQQKTGSSERPWTGGEPQWPQKKSWRNRGRETKLVVFRTSLIIQMSMSYDAICILTYIHNILFKCHMQYMYVCIYI